MVMVCLLGAALNAYGAAYADRRRVLHAVASAGCALCAVYWWGV